MRKGIFFFLLILISNVYSQQINYRLSMPKPQNHYFEVELIISDWNKDSLILEMPVWAPGSYLVRDFPKNVNQVKASDKSGNNLETFKVSKNKWLVRTKKVNQIRVNYEVYAFELSVRTSFLDLTHGFVSGSSVFMTVPDISKNKGELVVIPHKTFKNVTSALELIENKSDQIIYKFDNFDQLVDCPIEIGNHDIYSFESAGVKHTVAIYGEGNYFVENLIKDMSKIVENCTDVFGFNPNKDYTFIIHNVSDGQGGLEHSNSCVLSVNRWTYSSNYLGFLSLVAHEYFHLWNVKRIRPIELGPFDYSNENYTSLLWMMEGFTSYYDELLLLRAGYYNKSTFLAKLNSMINYVEGSNGSRVQSVSDASFDAWIKAYKRNENSHNVTMTYYSRGAIIASILDAMIIHNSKGKKKLDHFLRHIYNKYYIKKNRGFTENELKKELAKYTGENMEAFFKKYIRGTDILPFKEVLSKIGVEVIESESEKITSGLTIENVGGKIKVKRINANSTSELNGFSVGDEILAVNNYRINFNSFSQLLKTMEVDVFYDVLIARDEKLMELVLNAKNISTPKFILDEDKENKENALYHFWLH